MWERVRGWRCEERLCNGLSGCGDMARGYGGSRCVEEAGEHRQGGERNEELERGGEPDGVPGGRAVVAKQEREQPREQKYGSGLPEVVGDGWNDGAERRGKGLDGVRGFGRKEYC